MNKTLHFIWLGDTLPDYAKFAIDAFAQLNTSWEIVIYHHSLSEIEKLVQDSTTLLGKAHAYIFNNIGLISRRYSKIISDGVFNLTDVRYIQALSNVYRTFIVNHFGGIYLDCDTFPAKPFDDALFENEMFIADSHLQDGTQISDNFFFGSTRCGIFKSNMLELTTYPYAKHIVQTIPFWQNFPAFVIAKQKFFNCCLKIGEFSFSPDVYITHFADNRWKNTRHIRSIPLTPFDHILQQRLHDIG